MGTKDEPSGAWPGADSVPEALRDCAPWWLGSLERALRDRDYSAAAEANRELVRLGWHVTARPTRGCPAPSDAGRGGSQ